MDPLVSRSNPAINRNKVVLPHPLGPSKDTICPLLIEMERSEMAPTWPYALDIPSHRKITDVAVANMKFPNGCETSTESCSNLR